MSYHTQEPTLQLEIPHVLPGVDSAADGCVARLQERLIEQTGIHQVHLDEQNGKTLLCLHYDPNLVPLEKLERLARDEGAAITQRFRHETLLIAGMDCASCAASIEHIVRKQPGVLNVGVNYPTQKMKVEYDSTLVDRAALVKAVNKLGYRVPSGERGLPMALSTPRPNDHAGHEHTDPATAKPKDEHEGHSHAERGGWLQKNLELALSVLSGVLLTIGFAGEQWLGWPAAAAIAFYVGAYLAGGFNLTRHAVPAMLSGRFNVDFLMLAGAVGAAFLGEWGEGAFLLFLFSLGHALEHSAMEKARNAIAALGKLTPKTARVRRGAQEIEVPIEQIQVGDVAIVRPGDRVAVDGTIREGHSAIDQSPITGESVPVEKAPGDGVFAGTINGDGALEVEVTKLAQDTAIARVMQMVEEAQSQKAPSQTFSENFERVFVPVIIGVVVLAAIVPPLAGWLSWKEAVLRALSTLVAASPCALALATPAAVLAGIAQAARNGVLIKGGVHLENLGSLNAIAFDKTGTLTRGRPEVADIVPWEGVSEPQLLQIAAAVETRSSHPLAEAVVRRAQNDKLALPDSGELQNLQGRGVQAEVGGQLVRIGNARMFEEAKMPVPAALLEKVTLLGDSGKPTMIVSRGDKFLGALSFADEIRPESKKALEMLRQIGVGTLVMLTGDNARVASHIAPQAGVTEFRADLLPENKVEAINALIKQHGQVAMVGDGVNDAPALAQATVGIAMGAGGTDVALETADVALMGDDMAKLPFAVALSRQAKAIIRQNLWISLGVIAILVPSTLFGFARLGIAVIFHEGSTLIVVANALRLLKFRMRP